MKIGIAACAIALTQWIVAPSARGEVDDFGELKDAHDREILKLQLEFERQKQKLDTFYLDHLKGLQKQAQADGSLTKALSFRDEIKRFSESMELPASAAGEGAGALPEAQKKYQTLLDRSDQNLIGGSLRLFQRYIPRLEAIRTAMTKAGELEDALAVDDELKRANAELQTLKAQRKIVRPASSIPRIPPDAARWRNNHYKVFHKEKITFEEARAACEELGGHLVSIESSHERAFLAALGEKKKEPYWIGASDAEGEGEWRLLNGEPLPLKVHNNSSGRDYAVLSAAGPLGCRTKNGHYPESPYQWINGYICEWD